MAAATDKQTTAAAPRGLALVIGAYGLIGAALSRALVEDGWRVRGLGRSVEARRLAPWVSDWVSGDLRAMSDPSAWRDALDGVSLVVNAAGALDDGPRDSLDAVHGAAIEALVAAADAAGTERIIQISAPGVRPDAATAFYRTKARGDAAIAARKGDWIILRPGLVLAQPSYGGTALLRALAATPLVLPIAQPDARIQTVSMEDVAAATVAAARGDIASGADLALVERAPRTLLDLAKAYRAWMSLPPPALVIRAPDWAAAGVSALADIAVRLGWRTPLSSTARRVLADGVLADSAPAEAALGRPFETAEETLARQTPLQGARLLSRLFLLRPLLLIGLCVFWLASGVIGLIERDAAARVLEVTALAGGAAMASVVIGGIVDIGLGLALLWRPWARAACLGMLGVTLAYALGGTLLQPALWLDPLGPLVKTLPAALAALLAWTILEER